MADSDGKDEAVIFHDPRYCRTHAMVAELFARSSSRRPNAQAWSFNATAWEHLAQLKEREQARPKMPLTPR